MPIFINHAGPVADLIDAGAGVGQFQQYEAEHQMGLQDRAADRADLAGAAGVYGNLIADQRARGLADQRSATQFGIAGMRTGAQMAGIESREKIAGQNNQTKIDLTGQKINADRDMLAARIAAQSDRDDEKFDHEMDMMAEKKAIMEGRIRSQQEAAELRASRQQQRDQERRAHEQAMQAERIAAQQGRQQQADQIRAIRVQAEDLRQKRRTYLWAALNPGTMPDDAAKHRAAAEDLDRQIRILTNQMLRASGLPTAQSAIPGVGAVENGAGYALRPGAAQPMASPGMAPQPITQPAAVDPKHAEIVRMVAQEVKTQMPGADYATQKAAAIKRLQDFGVNPAQLGIQF